MDKKTEKGKLSQEEISHMLNKYIFIALIAMIILYAAFYFIFNNYLADRPENIEKCNEACRYGLKDIKVNKWSFKVVCICSSPFSNIDIINIPMPDKSKIVDINIS